VPDRHWKAPMTHGCSLSRGARAGSLPSTLSSHHSLRRPAIRPNLRVANVTLSRRAIASGRYDTERVLDTTLARLSADLNVLLRGC